MSKKLHKYNYCLNIWIYAVIHNIGLSFVSYVVRLSRSLIFLATSTGFGEKIQASSQSIFLNLFSDWFWDGSTFEISSRSGCDPPPGSGGDGGSGVGVGLVVFCVIFVGIDSKFDTIRKENFPYTLSLARNWPGDVPNIQRHECVLRHRIKWCASNSQRRVTSLYPLTMVGRVGKIIRWKNL